MKVSARAVELIKQFEGFRSRPYKDAVGVWTIGFGHTAGVGPSSKPVSLATATGMLRRDLDRHYAPPVRALRLPLSQHQFDALVSFVYNLGPGAIGASTGIGRALRAHRWRRAANEMLRWDKADGRRLLGLTRRRRAERALFLSAPSPLEGYTANEIRAIRQYDLWKRRNVNVPGRRRLRDEMKAMRKRVWRAAQGSGGWRAHNRRARYRSLLARTS